MQTGRRVAAARCEEKVVAKNLGEKITDQIEERPDWYEENIEEGIRALVKLLRDNGVNTECSCAHKMYVQCQYMLDGEIWRIKKLLYEKGLRDFTMDVKVQVINGKQYSSMDIKIDKPWEKTKNLGEKKEVGMGKKREIEQRIQNIREKWNWPGWAETRVEAQQGAMVDFFAEILKELDKIRKLLEGPVD